MSEQIPPQGPNQGWGPPPGYQGGGDPKAQAKSDKAYRKAQRPFYKKKRFIIPAGLVALLIIGGIAGGGSSNSTDSSTTAAGAPSSAAPSNAAPSSAAPSRSVTSKESDAAKNVTVTDCKVDDLGGTKFATIGYSVTNPTSKSSTYFIAIDVVDSTGARVSEANGIENNVLPGRPSQGTAAGNVSSSAAAPYTCTVGKVSRTAAN